jgi:hypothetical protein
VTTRAAAIEVFNHFCRRAKTGPAVVVYSVPDGRTGPSFHQLYERAVPQGAGNVWPEGPFNP